jgi:hypothetical protein
MRKAVLFVFLIIATLTALVAQAVPAGAAPSQVAACPHVNWGSLPEAGGPMLPSKITSVRVGSHPCFARLVIQTDGTQAPGFRVAYVPQITADGSGAVVPVAGGAKLLVIIRANGHDLNTGVRSFTLPRVGGETFKGLVSAGDFEGQTTVGLGVRARLPFRVFTLTNPPRVVLDVARHW